MGAKKFGMSLETQGIKLFWRDIPGFCRDIPEAPEKFEKKMFGFNSRPLFISKTKNKLHKKCHETPPKNLKFFFVPVLPFLAFWGISLFFLSDDFPCLAVHFFFKDSRGSVGMNNPRWMFRIFFIFFCSGGERGVRGAGKRGGERFLTENPRRGVSPGRVGGGGGARAGRVFARNFWGGGGG